MYSRLQENNENSGMSRPMKPAPPPPYNNVADTYPQIGGPMSSPAPAPMPAPAPTIISVNNIGTETSQPPGPKAVIMTCPQCRCRGKTKIIPKASAKAHLACLLLSWTLCCCCLPYYLSSCRNVDHYCQVCEAFVGRYSA